jgi:nitric oxide reductase subunit B
VEVIMQDTRRLWTWLGIVMFVSFGALGLLGREIYRNAPPIPAQVVAENGTVLFTADDIQTGRAVWQSAGGMQLGSIWGHGAYLAPDWSADWLHRESVALLERWSKEAGAAAFADLPAERQAALQARLKQELLCQSL